MGDQALFAMGATNATAISTGLRESLRCVAESPIPLLVLSLMMSQNLDPEIADELGFGRILM